MKLNQYFFILYLNNRTYYFAGCVAFLSGLNKSSWWQLYSFSGSAIDGDCLWIWQFIFLKKFLPAVFSLRHETIVQSYPSLRPMNSTIWRSHFPNPCLWSSSSMCISYMKSESSPSSNSILKWMKPIGCSLQNAITNLESSWKNSAALISSSQPHALSQNAFMSFRTKLKAQSMYSSGILLQDFAVALMSSLLNFVRNGTKEIKSGISRVSLISFLFAFSSRVCCLLASLLSFLCSFLYCSRDFILKSFLTKMCHFLRIRFCIFIRFYKGKKNC